MPEGDSLRRVAAALQPLVGSRVEVETPHPRAAGKRIAEQLDGRVLESADAVGKNLLLRFEGGLVLRSHLRMHGRWRVGRRGTLRGGTPWLVLRGGEHEAMLWHGPVLELGRDGATAGRLARHLGPDVLAEPLDVDVIVTRLRFTEQSRDFGEALLDQGLVAGIGNLWRSEALWEARLSPWRPLADMTDEELRAGLAAAHELMRASAGGTRLRQRVYRRAGRSCPRCGVAIRSQPQGDDARTVYWCPSCQPGGREPRR